MIALRELSQKVENRFPNNETAFDWGRASKVLDRFTQEQIPFLLIGTAAIALLMPEALEREPSDIDLMLPNDPVVLEKWVCSVSVMGFSVTSWNEPVRLPLDFHKLRGRYYLRAHKTDSRGKTIMVDATYESPVFSFEEAWQERKRFKSWNVAGPDHLCRLLEARSKPRDVRLASRLRDFLDCVHSETA